VNLALFDLDHTLVPFDTGMAWMEFLVGRGAVPASAQAHYLACCRQYVAGAVDIHTLHRAGVQALAGMPVARRDAWRQGFEARMATRLPADMLALVHRHREAGDLCAIVTATSRFIAEPFARLFGVDHLLATESATGGGPDGGAWTGEIDGLPCHREHKVTRVADWLASRLPPLQLGAFERSWFYSDSANDLPLLEAVSHPVAVRPDARLRERALRDNWPIMATTSA
jgi:HAD superfamily hydrolase (TIGR01490 family)